MKIKKEYLHKLNIALLIDLELRKEIEKLIERKKEIKDFSYKSLNDFLKKALVRYQKKEIKINSHYKAEKTERVNFKLTEKEWEAYSLIPAGIKSKIINSILKKQLEEELIKEANYSRSLINKENIKWEHSIVSADGRKKVNFCFEISKEQLKKEVEINTIRKIVNTNFTNKDGSFIYFFMPIVEKFWNIDEDKEYFFFVRSGDDKKKETDLIIKNDSKIIGIELTSSYSTENKKGSVLNQLPNKQKKKLEEKLENEKIGSDKVVVKIENEKNNIEILKKVMIERIKKKDRDGKYNIKEKVLLIDLIEEFCLIVGDCYGQIKGEKLNDYLSVWRIEKIKENLDNVEIKNFENLIIFFTSNNYPSCFNFDIVNNKVKEIKNISDRERETFEKKWNCRFDDIITQIIPFYSFLYGSKLSIKNNGF